MPGGVKVRCDGVPPIRVPSTPALIIGDGSLPPFVAAAIEAERGLRGDGAEGARAALAGLAGEGPEVGAALARQARLLDIEIDRSAAPALVAGDAVSLLAQAARVAEARRLRRVVWAVTGAGPDGEPDVVRVAAIIDAAICVTRALAAAAVLAGREAAAVSIETPLADLADDQVYDLFEDFALPLDACWWHTATGEAADAERLRWRRAAARRSALVMGDAAAR